MTQCKYLAVLPWRSRKRAVELLQPLSRWARVWVPLARSSLTQRTGAEEPRRGKVWESSGCCFFVLCFCFFRRTRDRPAGRRTHGRGIQGLQVKQERACACVRPPPLPSPRPPPPSSAAASGPMSLMQFWTKFYSQLGRPLPKVPVPFASSASVQTEPSNPFVKWVLCYSCCLFFSPSNLCQCSVSGWLAEVEALSWRVSNSQVMRFIAHIAARFQIRQGALMAVLFFLLTSLYEFQATSCVITMGTFSWLCSSSSWPQRSVECWVGLKWSLIIFFNTPFTYNCHCDSAVNTFLLLLLFLFPHHRGDNVPALPHVRQKTLEWLLISSVLCLNTCPLVFNSTSGFIPLLHVPTQHLQFNETENWQRGLVLLGPLTYCRTGSVGQRVRL